MIMGRKWKYDKETEFERRILRVLKNLEKERKIYTVVR